MNYCVVVRYLYIALFFCCLRTFGSLHYTNNIQLTKRRKFKLICYEVLFLFLSSHCKLRKLQRSITCVNKFIMKNAIVGHFIAML